jgi:hypothetical protein
MKALLAIFLVVLIELLYAVYSAVTSYANAVFTD